jgi:adenine-specific DNA-methyltransferase
VYRRVPHVTLKSIANNPDIREGMSRNEIDGAIARHGETELLCDQPYPDPQRVRVSGPFTVESLSPHRVLPADENPDGTITAQERRRHQDFTTMILDNLRKAGAQNTKKAERLVFETLEPFAGTWIHATGTYVEGSVGVSPAKLTVLPCRMNPDLAMGDELLKKTGAGNLFMIFGEPDIVPVDPRTGKLLPQKDGKYVVEIKGVDVYDPTTGAIRSSATDDIACWFIDTNYDGESFFVRHAYFTGSDEPYEKLKRALRAEIDEAAWSALYSTNGRPFEKPETGKVAVKVINHYGDEVLKVFAV